MGRNLIPFPRDVSVAWPWAIHTSPHLCDMIAVPVVRYSWHILKAALWKGAPKSVPGESAPQPITSGVATFLHLYMSPLYVLLSYVTFWPLTLT